MKKIIYFIVFWFAFSWLPAQNADSVKLLEHLNYLCNDNYVRHYLDMKGLNRAANYIFEEFSKANGFVSEQKYQVKGETFRNIIFSTDTSDLPRIVLGAHYDVYGKQAGADDNASGVVALLELSRLLSLSKNNLFRIDLVAFTNEEPPFFRSKDMGSYQHAQLLHQLKANVAFMVSIDMIGYFNDEEGSQQYPDKSFAQKHGTKADFLAVIDDVGNFSSPFAQLLCQSEKLRFLCFTAKELPNLGLSDHINYRHFGFQAMMISNTAFYRTPHYHTPADRLETLDLERLSNAINAIYHALYLLKTD